MGEGFRLGKIMSLVTTFRALFGILRKLVSTDHKMKHGKTLCVVWLCGRLLPFAGTREEGTMHKVIAMTVRVVGCPC
jgi:hypothetical protein